MKSIFKTFTLVTILSSLCGCAFPDKDGDFGAYVHSCQKYAYAKSYAFEHRDFAYKVCKDAAKLWGGKFRPTLSGRFAFIQKYLPMKSNMLQWLVL
jgi:hypothetical protein